MRSICTPRRAGPAVWTAVSAVLLAATVSAAELVPNADFADGEETPSGWELTGGQGRWVDHRVLEVTGTGSDSSYWRCGDVALTPGRLYCFRMRTRRTGGAGTAIAGPVFANRDYRDLSESWQWHGHVFRVPDRAGASYLRLGQWHATGSIQFDAVRITPALPVHRRVGEAVLGEGETIRGGQYRFQGTFGHEGSNYHRTLAGATASFNSDRWGFGPGSEVTYRFELPGSRFVSADVSFNVNYHTRGGCTAEVSRDGSDWHALATQDAVGSAAAAVPAAILPAEQVLLRLRSSGSNGSFQVNRVEFTAGLDGAPPEAIGKTAFVNLEVERPGLAIEGAVLEDAESSGRLVLYVTAANRGSEAVEATLGGKVVGADGAVLPLSAQQARIAPEETARFVLEIPAKEPGEHDVHLDLGGARPGDGEVQARLRVSVPDYYRTDYGRLVSGSTGGTAVWWCDATHKIPRQRPPPVVVGKEVELSAASNDYEAVQVVVRPTEPLVGLTAKVRVTKSEGNTLTAEDVKVLRVYYHFVDHATDATGVEDWWPDALPPLSTPIDVERGTNQPLWVLFHVPEETRAGDHHFELNLEAEGFSATVPIRLHVWDFALPQQNHLETAFGLSAGSVFRYHQLKTEADKRKVLDMYFKSFAEHRISPYDPAPLDPIRVHFATQSEPPRAEVDFSSFDRAMARGVDEFGFTNIRLRVEGMGGGSFHRRYEPKIGEHTEDTPQYQAMFSSYVEQLEAHLRDRGWLDMAYVYWFDEPSPKDYDFVRAGMERLKRYAPGLRTMLTEEPGEELAGPVDIWCPVTSRYDHEAAEKRRAQGERFWWYVCTGPKAPYCTLFIDHPATEFRVWLWQTWQRDVRGILVWQSNYWTSSAAYPDEPQNPYEDPMGYRSGYSTPRGVKAYWGNGDGRFIYPPPAAAVPGASGPGPVIAPPVSSIRWEMLREGIEDYEFLYRLRELVAERREGLAPGEVRDYEALLEVPESITADMTKFTTDPAPIYARRRAIAEAIERLAR